MKKVTSPSAQLAELTVDRLIKGGFLRAERRDALIAKLAAGTVSASDWQLEIDLASEKAVGQ